MTIIFAVVSKLNLELVKERFNVSGEILKRAWTKFWINKKKSSLKLIRFIDTVTALKMMFCMKYFFSKCGQIDSFLQIWSYSLKKCSINSIIYCAFSITKITVKTGQIGNSKTMPGISSSSRFFLMKLGFN